MVSWCTSMTSLTASTNAPIVTTPSSTSMLITIMQESSVSSFLGMPNLIRASITGNTFPRRLITPNRKPGDLGTLVILLISRISMTLITSMANNSSINRKVRNDRIAFFTSVCSSVICLLLLFDFFHFDGGCAYSPVSPDQLPMPPYRRREWLPRKTHPDGDRDDRVVLAPPGSPRQYGLPLAQPAFRFERS